jgi:thiol-disulfide isomerase/thioredoxin
MLARLVIIGVIVSASFILLKLFQQATFQRRIRDGLGLPAYQLGLPAILYFTAPGCTACEITQGPSLSAIATRYPNEVQIFTHDATADTDLAQAWGVLTVPTTFLIDPQGRPRRVNHGAVGPEKLIEQLTQIGGSISGQAGRLTWERAQRADRSMEK